MSDDYEELADRVATLERALTDDAGVAGLARPTQTNAPPDDPATEERLTAIEADLTDLEAALLAVRSYVGRVRHVNREVERTAETALATAERAAETACRSGRGTGPDPDGRSPGPLVAPNGDPIDALGGPGVLDDATDVPPDRSPPPDEDESNASLLARVRDVV